MDHVYTCHCLFGHGVEWWVVLRELLLLNKSVIGKKLFVCVCLWVFFGGGGRGWAAE